MNIATRLRLTVSLALLGFVGAANICLAQGEQPASAKPAPVYNVPINAPVPPITIDAGDEQITGVNPDFDKTGQFTFSGGATVVGGTEFVLRADTLSGNLSEGVVTAVGHVHFRELNSYIDADSIFASRDVAKQPSTIGDTWSGAAQDVVVRSSPYTIIAQRLKIEPNEIELYSTTLDTCPPDQKSEYSIRASKIVYQPLIHRITIYGGSFYIGKTRIFEFKKLSRRTGSLAGGAAAGDKLFNETVGYTGYSGPFIGYTTHFGQSNTSITGTLLVPEKHGVEILVVGKTPIITPRSKAPAEAPKTVLGKIRQAVEATEPILPEGDPLLFHWFQTVTTMEDRFQTIPNSLTVNGIGTLSYRERVYGHETDNLFYSRIPEASMSAIAPISGPRTLPTSHDPGQVRAALKQIALYAVLTPTYGLYHEDPDGITTTRESTRLDIESRPILVRNNLLFKPTISYLDSSYPEKHQAFKIFQYDLAIERYVTDTTGYGLEYIDSKENGSSPFQFDTPFTTQEIDGRVQYGFPHVIVGAILKYDINGKNLYEEEIMVAPIMRSLVPRFTYDFRDSTFAIGIDIKGLTY